jgi:crotonobetainyl-CoA:carnitine CoA-transferase CaiB-like acyl-CoA transferase
MRPLAGILVVAVEQAVAAPVCTRHLGDLGARVIKVENRAGGDFARGYDEYVKGMSAYFAWANRNKESVALDLKHPLGREVLARLAAKADVVVQNLAPPVVPGWDWRLDPIPALGEHTVPVLRELGFAPDEVESMLAAGAAGPR